MSRFRQEGVTCPSCGSAGTAKIWDSVNPTVDPSLKIELLEGRLMTYLCPSCGTETHLEHNLLYHDLDQELLIWLTCGPGNVPDTRAMHLFEGLELPYSKRIVRSPRHLAEKILAFDAGLDDRVVEVVKVVSWRQAFGPELPGPDEYCFLGMESDAGRDSLWYARITGGDPEDWPTVEVELEQYQALAETLAPQLTHRLSDGWWEIDFGFAVQLLARIDNEIVTAESSMIGGDHTMDLEAMRRRMTSLPDDELLQIVGPERGTYRPEAVELAEAELHERGSRSSTDPSSASGVDGETIELAAFRIGLSGTQYRELVQHHVRNQSLHQLKMGAIGTIEMLPRNTRPALEVAIDEWNETAHYELLWQSSSVDVFDRMLETGRILLEGVGIEPTDDHLFNICQVFILTHAAGASENRALRKFAGIKKGIFG